MEFVHPLKSIEKINAIKERLKKQSQKDLVLFVFGINTRVRISALLSLMVEDIWGETRIKEFLSISDDKSDKVNAYIL